MAFRNVVCPCCKSSEVSPDYGAVDFMEMEGIEEPDYTPMYCWDCGVEFKQANE